MTTYNTSRGTVTLDRSSVRAQLAESERMANVAFRGGSRSQRDYFSSAEIRALGERYRSDAARLRGVIAAIDAGLEELPAHLYP
jgi:hypothetical protein